MLSSRRSALFCKLQFRKAILSFWEEPPTEIVKVTRRPTEGQSGSNTNPETGESKTHNYPPHPKKCSRHVKQDAVEDQKGNFNRPQNKENQKCNSYSALQVFTIERIVERWCFLFLHLYPRNSLGVREPFGGVGDGKTNKEDQGEQVGSIVPKEPLFIGVSDGESPDR